MNALVIVAANENPWELRQLTQLLLTTFPGCIVYECVDPRDVARYLRTHTVDLVFLDMKLTQIDGITLLNQVRQINGKIPVVVSAEDDDYLDEAMWSGADEYLVRPLTAGQLHAYREKMVHSRAV